MSELQSNIGDRVVTLVALRVDGRKMPISIFRQVPRFDCLDGQHEFDPGLNAWGRVLLKIANEGTEWLLAEREGQLVRCCLDLPSLSSWAVEHHARQIATHEESPGVPRPKLSDFDLGQLARHKAELNRAQADLAIAKLRHAALVRLQSLPQLFLG